jgi:YidC/Oxa1 family membrane protein insertase
VNDEQIYDFTKQFKAVVPLAFKNGEIDQKMNWYYGPTDYDLLKTYDRNLEDIALGWGI